jgi:dTDP-4-dehydrorhamnose 3,5-epimerase
VLLIEPGVFTDERGFFLEAFNEKRFAEHGLPTCFRQDNHSRSIRNVLRGLHYQQHRPQGKLVTVISGRIFDVAVDVRRDSPTFGQWYGTELSGNKPTYVWVPAGFAHGLCVLSDIADVVYKCTEPYAPDDERGVRWDDPALGIEWPIRAPVLSRKDRSFMSLDARRSDLPIMR